MTTNFASVAVVGLGYIGLPTAVTIADHGVRTTGVDISETTVSQVQKGELPFVEPGLQDVLKRTVANGQLTAQTDMPAADAYVIAVPTPFTDALSADLSYIETAATNVAAKLEGGELIVLESTSPPGATEHMRDVILRARPDLDSTDLLVAHCPERVLPGKIMKEMLTNDRIIGGIGKNAAQAARDLYATFCQGELLLTDAKTAEMTKLTENSFRDVNIAFANELSIICHKLGIDVWELIELANHHPRVNILQPGPGVGGHCIAVDPWFIVDAAPEEANLIRTARQTNDAKPEWVLGRIQQALESRAPGAKVALLGLAFKANIDDLRESPALAIVEKFSSLAIGTKLLIVEPHIEELPSRLASRGNVTLVSTERSIQEADIIVLLVDHDTFTDVDTSQLEGKTVIDTRGMWR